MPCDDNVLRHGDAGLAAFGNNVFRRGPANVDVIMTSQGICKAHSSDTVDTSCFDNCGPGLLPAGKPRITADRRCFQGGRGKTSNLHQQGVRNNAARDLKEQLRTEEFFREGNVAPRELTPEELDLVGDGLQCSVSGVCHCCVGVDGIANLVRNLLFRNVYIRNCCKVSRHSTWPN